MRLGLDEQRAALRSVRALTASTRLRVTRDREGWPIIPGRRGQIEYHDGVELAVYTDRPRLFAKLWSIPGVRRHQTGSDEMRARFPSVALQQVAEVIGARTRRVLSSQAARQLGASTAYSATSRGQERVREAGLGPDTPRPVGGPTHANPAARTERSRARTPQPSLGRLRR